MQNKSIKDYTVIKDTREKLGWEFYKSHPNKRSPKCCGMKVGTLTTGDYTLIGYEDILTIERKDSFAELWNNYGNKERFEKEMARMSKFKYAYILIESSITPEILELSPPQYRTGVPGKAMVKWLLALGMKYNINIIPVGRCGLKFSELIFEEVVRAERL